VGEARRRGDEYLLERRLFRRRTTGEVIDSSWLRFSFPHWYHYDVLRALDYLRDGKTQTSSLKLGSRPSSALAAGDHENGSKEGVLNGVTVGDITPDIRGQLQLPETVQGAVITDVDPGSASARAGLNRGDVILDLDRKPVHNADDAVRLSDEIKGPKVLVRLWRNGASQYVVVDESQ